jgi:hypothetical protein
VTRATNGMPPKKPPAEEGATDPADEVAEPPPLNNSSVEFARVNFPRDNDDWQAIVAANTADDTQFAM